MGASRGREGKWSEQEEGGSRGGREGSRDRSEELELKKKGLYR